MANIALKRDDNTAEGWTERHGIRFRNIRADLTGKINDASTMEEYVSTENTGGVSIPWVMRAC